MRPRYHDSMHMHTIHIVQQVQQVSALWPSHFGLHRLAAISYFMLPLQPHFLDAIGFGTHTRCFTPLLPAAWRCFVSACILASTQLIV